MCPCQVCTEARDATKNAKKRVQKPKLGPAKRARKRERGPFQGRRTSRFAGKYMTSKTREKTKKHPTEVSLVARKKKSKENEVLLWKARGFGRYLPSGKLT